MKKQFLFMVSLFSLFFSSANAMHRIMSRWKVVSCKPARLKCALTSRALVSRPRATRNFSTDDKPATNSGAGKCNAEKKPLVSAKLSIAELAGEVFKACHAEEDISKIKKLSAEFNQFMQDNRAHLDPNHIKECTRRLNLIITHKEHKIKYPQLSEFTNFRLFLLDKAMMGKSSDPEKEAK